MTNRTMEIGVGVFVALGLAALLMLAMKVSNLASLSGGDGYRITAHFNNVGGLKERSPVTMSGVRIGRVADISYDRERFDAVVTMEIEREFDAIPKDSSAAIFTAGLLGEQYIGIEAGGDESMLEQGDELQLTQSALVLEQVIGQFLYSQASKGGESAK